MPKIETQGISEDYSLATGEFSPIDRGEVSRIELENILQKVVSLRLPESSEQCPPSVNAILSGNRFTCFFANAGMIHCTDSKVAAMSVDEAVQIICGEATIAEYDAAKGYRIPGFKLACAGIGLISVLAYFGV